MKTLVNSLLLFLFVLGGHAADVRPTVAVLDFESIGSEEHLGRAVAEIMRTELIGTRRFRVVERSQINKALSEQTFQKSGVIDESNAVEIGKLLGADLIIIGSVVKIGTSYTINSRMIDIKTGEATLGENATGNDLNLLTSLSRSLLDDLLGPEWKQADPKSQRDKRDLADSANKGTREKATKGLSEGSGDESGAKDYMSLDKWEILDGSWYAEDGAIIGSGGHIIMNEEFRDSVFKVNVEHLSGPKSGVGIGTRSTVVPGGQKSFRNHTSINQGYAFNFSFEKNYNIYSGLSGNWYPMNPNWKKYEWQRSELFREDVNNVRVEAIGKHTKIYVNNRFLVEYEDSSHTVGAPLLWVQDPAEKVRFFNIRIHRK